MKYRYRLNALEPKPLTRLSHQLRSFLLVLIILHLTFIFHPFSCLHLFGIIEVEVDHQNILYCFYLIYYYPKLNQIA